MKIFDLHNDFLTCLKTSRKKEAYLFSKKTREEGDICSAVWTTEMDSEKALETIENSFEFVKNHNEKTKNTAYNAQKLCLSIEDMNFVSKYSLDRVINAHPTYCSLTWNFNNKLAGGAKEGGDLSLFGLEVVDSLERNGIIVDTAHLSERSFMSLAKISRNPILCSHTAAYSLTQNPRCLKDYQLSMINSSGGLVGVALVGNFLTDMPRAEVKDVARHIDYIASRFSPEMVALGTDFYGTKNLPRGLNCYSSLKLLRERLETMGYDQKTIEDIFYNNAANFFNKVYLREDDL